MEPEVRERILQNLLVRMDAPAPSRSRRSWPLLTAAAVLLVAVAVTVATTLAGTWSDPRPAAGDTVARQLLDPLPADQLPPPSGDPEIDAALVRCATAVVRSGRAAEYPPTTTWRDAQNHSIGVGPLDRLLSIDGRFGCLLTPESVILSGLTGTPVGDLQLVRMTSSLLVALNPQQLWFTLGDQQRQWIGYPVMGVPLGGENVDDLRIAVYEPGDLPGSEPGGGGDNALRWSGPVPELVQGVTVADRVLPRRTDTLDDAELANCLVGQPAPTVSGAGNELWIPAGRHDVGDAAPTALVARVGDIAAGLCIVDPSVGPRFASGLLPAQADPGRALLALRTETTAGVVLTTPGEELTRVEIAPTADPAGSRPCTFLDGLVVCTLEIGETGGADDTGDLSALTGFVVTAYTAGSTEGKLLYPVL
jgi:hypothetical protein